MTGWRGDGRDRDVRMLTLPVQYRLPADTTRNAGLPGPIARTARPGDPRSASLVGTWVAGRMLLTADVVALIPSGIAARLSVADARIDLRLREVTDIACRRAFTGGIVVLATPATTVLIRCRGAQRVAARIRVAWAQALARPD